MTLRGRSRRHRKTSLFQSLCRCAAGVPDTDTAYVIAPSSTYMYVGISTCLRRSHLFTDEYLFSRLLTHKTTDPHTAIALPYQHCWRRAPCTPLAYDVCPFRSISHALSGGTSFPDQCILNYTYRFTNGPWGEPILPGYGIDKRVE